MYHPGGARVETYMYLIRCPPAFCPAGVCQPAQTKLWTASTQHQHASIIIKRHQTDMQPCTPTRDGEALIAQTASAAAATAGWLRLPTYPGRTDESMDETAAHSLAPDARGNCMLQHKRPVWPNTPCSWVVQQNIQQTARPAAGAEPSCALRSS